jgi:hypothetical protein
VLTDVGDKGEQTDLKDRLGDQRGGSEWEPIKILLQRENSAYAPNSQPRIPTRVCQSRVVTTDLPTLGANPKRSQSKSKTQRSKELSSSARHQADSPVTGWMVCVVRADGPRVTDGQSEKGSRPSCNAPRITNSPRPVLGRSASNQCRADGPRRPGGRSAKLLSARNSWPNEDAQEHATNTKNSRPTGSTRTVRAYQADCLPSANRRKKSRPRARTRAPYHLSFHGSSKRLKLLRKDLGKM